MLLALDPSTQLRLIESPGSPELGSPRDFSGACHALHGARGKADNLDHPLHHYALSLPHYNNLHIGRYALVVKRSFPDVEPVLSGSTHICSSGVRREKVFAVPALAALQSTRV